MTGRPRSSSRAGSRARGAVIAWGIWLLGSLLPKRPRSVVVHSIPDWEDGALAVLAELLDRGYRPIALLEPSGSPCPDARIAAVVECRLKNTWPGRLAYLTSALVITTHTVYRPHRLLRGQRMLNLWHGERLNKKVGRWDGQAGLPCTWAVASSVIGQAFRCVQMDVPPERVLVVGSPRNDRMLHADVAQVREALLRPGAHRTFLWLPTYRLSRITGRVDGDASRRASLGFNELDLAHLQEWLAAADVDVLVKPHPQSAQAHWPSYSHLRTLDSRRIHERGVSLFQLLAAVDGLITDASAVWVDYVLLDRPIVFSFPDIESYRAGRGLLLEPFETWVPGPLATTMPDLIRALGDVVSGRDDYRRARAEWRHRAHRYHDGQSTRRLFDAVEI